MTSLARTPTLSLLLAGLLLLALSPAVSADEDAARTLSAARAALSDGLYEVAEKQLRLYLEAFGPDSDASNAVLPDLLHALGGQDKAAEAIALYTARADALRDSPHWPGVRFWAAQAYLGANDAAAAEELLKDFATEHADSALVPAAQALRARALIQLDRLDEAEPHLAAVDAALEDGVNKWRNLLEWSKLLIAKGATQEAEASLRRLTAESQDLHLKHQAQFWLAQIYAERGEDADARAELRGVATNTNAAAVDRSRAWTGISETYQYQAQYSNAVDALRRSLALAPNSEITNRTAVVLGQLLLQMGELEDGILYLKMFIAGEPGNPESGAMQLRIARTLLDTNAFTRAAAEYQLYLESFSDPAGTAAAYAGKGWSLFKEGERYAEAAAAFEKAYSLATSDDDQQRALFKVGDSLFANRQYKRAMESYRRLLAEHPESATTPQAEFQMAECMFRSEQFAEAEAAYTAIAAAEKKSPYAQQALLRLGELKEQERSFDDALAFYDRVIEENSASAAAPDALLNRGVLSYQLYRFGESLSAFTRLVDGHPDHEHIEYATFMSATCQYMMYDSKTAVSAWGVFLDRYPESQWAADTYFWLGKHDYNAGDFISAESNFLAVVAHHPEHELADDALMRAGQSATEQKDYRGAIEHFTQIAIDYPDSPEIPEARYYQGDALCGNAAFAEAILLFDDIIKRFPDHYLVDHAWRRKGDCNFLLGTQDKERFDLAVQAFETVIRSSSAPLDLVLNAEYMIGRCREAQDRDVDALSRYYRVLARYSDERAAGTWHNEASKLWFTRASYNAYDILYEDEQWRQAVEVLKRVIEADVPAGGEARRRIDSIRKTRWWIQY